MLVWLRIPLFGGFFFSTDASRWVLLCGGFFFSMLLILFALLLMRDVAWGISALIAKASKKPCRYPANRIALGITIAALIISAFGIYSGAQTPKIRNVKLAFDHLPPGLEHFRIAVIADLHASGMNREGYVSSVVRRTNAAKPDMIVLPGDLVDGRVASRFEDVLPLRKLKAPYGVYGCPGNHEYYSGYAEWMNCFRSLGIDMLEGVGRTIEVNGTKLGLAGIEDLAAFWSRTGTRANATARPSLNRALRDLIGADFKILLAHRPGTLCENTDVSLQISGHTHGGLVWLLDRWVVSPLNDGFVRGLYQVGKTLVYVSSGAGLWSGYPVRLGVPSEITILELISSKPSAPLQKK